MNELHKALSKRSNFLFNYQREQSDLSWAIHAALVFLVFFIAVNLNAYAEESFEVPQVPNANENLEKFEQPSASEREDWPTAGELIDLRSLGYSNEEIKAVLQPFKGKLEYDKESLSELMQAGFSEDFLQFVHSLQPKIQLTNSDVAGMIDQGLSTTEILERIAASDTTFDGSAKAILDLKSGRLVPDVIAKAVIGRRLKPNDLVMLSEREVPDEHLERLLDIVGHEVDLEDAGAALQLLQAGLSTSVVDRMKRSGAQIAGESDSSGASADDVKLAEDEIETFTHATDLFSFPYPRNWFFEREVQGETTIYYASPIRPRTGDVARLAPDVVSMTLRYWRQDDARANEIHPAEMLDDNMSRYFAHALDEIEPLGETKPVAIDGREGAYRDYQAVIDDQRVGLRWYVVDADGYSIGVMATSPERQFDQMLPTFSQLADSIVINGMPFASSETGKAFAGEELVSRYKEAVVHIYASDQPGGVGDGNGGTGFFVRSDGYILTNAHVILDRKTQRPFKHFQISWSAEFGREPVQAEHVGHLMRSSPIDAPFNSGDDLALLKVSGIGKYKSIPLTPLDDVNVGEQIITIGFPNADYFDRQNATTVTAGNVSRFNRHTDGRIETIISDATLAPGNSGGPAISLSTGGVVGLNTATTVRRVADGLGRDYRSPFGYSIIMPIDRAIESYPQQTMVTTERDGGLDAIDAFDLARFTYDRGWRAGAIELADKAVQRAPSSAPAHLLYAKALMMPHRDRTLEDRDKAKKALDRALELDPLFQDALFAKADISIEDAAYLDAIKAANSAIAIEETSTAFIKRARIYITQRQYGDALVDLERAKELSDGRLVEPFLLSGEIRYAQELFDQGLKDYQHAVTISPNSVEARLGVGQYYMFVEKYLLALLEFDALKADEPRNPRVHAAIGNAYWHQGNFGESLKSIEIAIGLYTAGQKIPPREMVEEAIDLAEAHDQAAAASLYALYLGYYYDDEARALAGHRFLAERSEGVVKRMHLQRAIAIKGLIRDAERSRYERMLNEVAESRLGWQEVGHMQGPRLSSCAHRTHVESL